MNNFSKDIKNIILNYNDWNIKTLISKLQVCEHPKCIDMNIEKLIIKCLQLGFVGFFINYNSRTKLNTAYELNKQYINTNYHLKNNLVCYTEDKNFIITVNVKGKLVDLPTLLLIN